MDACGADMGSLRINTIKLRLEFVALDELVRVGTCVHISPRLGIGILVLASTFGDVLTQLLSTLYFHGQ